MTRPSLSREALARLDEVVARPAGRRLGVLGLGIAGRAMALYARKKGAHVIGVDKKAELTGDALRAAGVELRLGEVTEKSFDDVEALLLSPGADPRQPAVRRAYERGLPVLGELELVWPDLADKRIAAVTGTNGKSTTTALLGALVKAVEPTSFVGGNLGEPVAKFLHEGGVAKTLVLELSSFQLESVQRFRPSVAVVLNVTPDHLDRYASVEEYAGAKQLLVEQLPPGGTAVLSFDDPVVRRMAEVCRGRVLWLSTMGRDIPGDGAVLEGDRLVPRGSVSGLGSIDLSHPRLFGRHNRENALAALLSAWALGISDRAALERAYRAFEGLEHRLELAGEWRGVRFINDSKATNDDAAAIAVQAMAGPLVLLLGGRSKGGGYKGLEAALGDKVRAIVAFGEARREIAESFARHPGLVVVDTIRQAFDAAVGAARPGDTVLLAPACSSYDEFKDYTERGRTFKGWVRALLEDVR